LTPADRTDRAWDFDAWAETYDAAVADAHGYYECYADVLDAVVTVAQIGPSKSVLDIGTGTGNLALKYLGCGAEVTGLDPSEGMLAKARQKAGADSPIRFMRVEQPFLQIPFADGSFDAVVSAYAFHHLPRPRHADAVREMLRVAKPGGTVALADIAFESAEAEQDALRRFDWLEQEYFAHIGDLRSAFAEHGAALKARQYTPVTWVLWTVKPDG
jgi:putative AdoMet-dependent methyltransferase